MNKAIEQNNSKPTQEEFSLNKIQIITYSFLVIISLIIFIVSMIGVDILILLISIGISVTYIYFDQDLFKEEGSSETVGYSEEN